MNSLEQSMKLIADQVNLRKGPAIIRKADLKWETTSMASRSALIMHPKINGSVAQKSNGI